MSVGTYALVTSDMAFNHIGQAKANGLSIFCNASGATGATVEVTDTTLILIITGGASAGTNTLTFANADSDTLAELIVKINALAGWKASALYYGGASSTDLVVTGALSCLGSANEQTLMIKRIYESDKLVDRATDVIERWAGRLLKSRTYDRERYAGRRWNRLVLDQYPVTRIGRVSVGGINAFSVTNTTALNFATVEVTSTLVRLNADGTVTDITISSHETITALIAAINAVSGWTATAVNSDASTRAAYYTSLDGTTKVPEVLPLAAAYCLSPNVAYVEVPDIDMTDAALKSGTGEDRGDGILFSPSGWNYDSIFVDYVAGYSTIPAALEDLCLALVKLKYDQGRKDLSVQSEKIGNVYSYTLGDMKKVAADVMEEAAAFRKLVF